MGTWYAKNLQEYVEIVQKISENNRAETRDYPLWFRGMEQTGTRYYLEPGIFRDITKGREKNLCNDEGTYGTLWLKEEYRYQHFAARNYDKIRSMPEHLVEWQEVMQHYFSKTRLMDWSESSMIALTFALEAYIDPAVNHEVEFRRRHNSPVVWVLNPIKLNQKVFECFKSNSYFLENALLFIEEDERRKIVDDFMRNPQIYFELDNSVNGGVNGLVSLSGLEKLRDFYGSMVEHALKEKHFNPFFYLLFSYYSDGRAVAVNELPPLAIIHPYHSDRINVQKGAFTIFPYYKKPQSVLEKTGVSPFAMEYMSTCNECLERIILTNAWDTAKQLKVMGVRRSHVYPEMEIVTKDFEYI